MALISSVYGLLTDTLTGTSHKPNRELFVQGIGKVSAGALGTLPGAGEPSGATVSVRAGGTTPVSVVTCAAVLRALAPGPGWIAAPMPMVALSGILINVAWDSIDGQLITRVRQVQRECRTGMMLTLAITVFVDLITATKIGLIVAGFARAQEQCELGRVISIPLLERGFFADNSGDEDVDQFQARVGLVDLRGEFSFASANEWDWMVGADIRQQEGVIFDFSIPCTWTTARP